MGRVSQWRCLLPELVSVTHLPCAVRLVFFVVMTFYQTWIVSVATLVSLVPRPSLSLSFAVKILEAGKKELVKQEEGLVKLIT